MYKKQESIESLSSESTYCIKNGHGKQGLVCSKIIKTTMKDIICKFSFTIKVDHLGFYVHLKNQCGHPIQTGHPQPYESDAIPIPSQLLREEEIKDMASAANAVCNNSVVLNFMEGKFKKFINSMCCGYLICKYNGKRKCSKDDIFVMLADFQQSKEIEFTILSNILINELSSN